MRFPEYFPEGCPPAEASDNEILLFRFCQSAIPTEDDFVSYYQRNPKKYSGNIQAYGLSVFPTEEDCISARKKSPFLSKKYPFWSSGKNTPERGKTLKTPSKENPAHITWWVYEGVSPHTFFVGCSEEGGKDE